MILDIANTLFGNTMVPMAETMDIESFSYVLNLT